MNCSAKVGMIKLTVPCRRLVAARRIFMFLSLLLLRASPANSLADVDQILSSMTLKQKIGQMVMGDVSEFAIGGDINSVQPKAYVREFSIGFLFDTTGRLCQDSIRMSNSIWNNMALNVGSIRVPVALAMDAVRGPAFLFDPTLFPHNINLAATWNLELALTQGEITGKDLRACGWHIALAPAADNGNVPLWGRFYETFGSQPLSGAAFSAALIEGIQKNSSRPFKDQNLGNFSSVPSAAACLKHWVGYGFPDTGKDRDDATVSDPLFERVVLPTLRDSLMNANPLLVMINSGTMNKIPGHADKGIIRNLLQREFNYTGVVLSDFDDWFRIATRHNFARSTDEAVQIAIDAGMDVHLTEALSEATMRTIYRLVTSGKISEARIDESARRVLVLKQKLGLLDGVDVAGQPDVLQSYVWSPENRMIASQIALESIILLQNNNDALPFRNGDGIKRRILVTGPTADSVANMCGGWLFSWGSTDGSRSVPKQNITSLLDGVRRYAFKWNWEVEYERGCELKACDPGALARAVAAARRADLIVVGVGEGPYVEFQEPITDLTFPESQLTLIRSMRGAIGTENKKSIIAVQFSGRPRLWTEAATSVDSILIASLPCFSGGDAVSRILFGYENPSGRLPFPYPSKATVQRLELDDSTHWRPFGFGLSFTSFNYSNMKLLPNSIDLSNPASMLTVSVDVENTGGVTGDVAVLLRVSEPLDDTNSSSWMRLQRFTKLTGMNPGEKRSVRFVLFGADLRFLTPQPGQISTSFAQIEDIQAALSCYLSEPRPRFSRTMSNTLAFLGNISIPDVEAPHTTEKPPSTTSIPAAVPQTGQNEPPAASPMISTEPMQIQTPVLLRNVPIVHVTSTAKSRDCFQAATFAVAVFTHTVLLLHQ